MEEKSKLQLIGEIAQADNKNLELIEEINEKEDEIERLQEKINYKETLVQGLDNTIEAYEKTIVEQEDKIERLNNILNELEKYLIEYFKKEYPDRKLEDYNLENCTYDYALVILGKLQELKGSNEAIPPEVIGTNGEDGGLFDYGDR